MGDVSVLVVAFPPGSPADGKSLMGVTSRISADRPFHVLLDWENVEQVQGPFFGELLKLMKLLRGNGGSLKLYQLCQPIHDVLRGTRMERRFEWFSNSAAALVSFAPVASPPAAGDNSGEPQLPG